MELTIRAARTQRETRDSPYGSRSGRKFPRTWRFSQDGTRAEGATDHLDTPLPSFGARPAGPPSSGRRRCSARSAVLPTVFSTAASMRRQQRRHLGQHREQTAGALARARMAGPNLRRNSTCVASAGDRALSAPRRPAGSPGGLSSLACAAPSCAGARRAAPSRCACMPR